MKDELASPLLESLGACLRKLKQLQFRAEGPRTTPWPEIVRAEEAVRGFTSATTGMTLSEGLVYDLFDAAMARFESFARQFAGTARTPDQHRIADQFSEFVDELGGAVFGREPPGPIWRDKRYREGHGHGGPSTYWRGKCCR